MTTATETAPLTVHRLELHDFCKIESKVIDCKGKNVKITGDNGEGKSTIVNALLALGGQRRATEMPEPIRKGKDRCELLAILGDNVGWQLKLERVYTPKGTKLQLVGVDGHKFTRTEEMVRSLFDSGLNLTEFDRARPQDQVDEVLFSGGVKPPVEAVEEITGERHEAKPGESAEAYLMRLSADEDGLYYHRRREANRILTTKAKAEQEQQQQLQAMGGALGEEELATAGDVLKEIAKLQEQADHRRELGSKAKLLAAESQAGQTKLSQLETQWNDELKNIEQLERQLANRREVAALLESRIAKGREIEASRMAVAQEAMNAFHAAYDPYAKIEAAKLILSQIETTNAKLAKRRAAAENLERLTTERADAEAEHERLDKVVSRLRHLRAHLLDGVDLGIEGLEVGSGELRLDGITLRQASQAQRYVVAASVRMLRPARLKVLIIDGGESLGEEAREAVYAIAREKGYQVWFVERTAGELKIEIEEAA